MGVYTGTNPASLTPVAQDDDSGGFFTSMVSFNCVQRTPLTRLRWRVINGAAGTAYVVLVPARASSCWTPII